MNRTVNHCLMILFGSVLFAPSGSALSLRAYLDEEIIEEADVVAEGVVTRISQPDPAAVKGKYGASIAYTTITTVFKGNVKKDATVSVAYWSHAPKNADRWSGPDTYTVGEKGLFALKQRDPKCWLREMVSPPDFAEVRWINPYRAHYNGQVQSADFRAIAGLYAEPNRHAADPNVKIRQAALYFLAQKKALSESQWDAIKRSTDSRDIQLVLLAVKLKDGDDGLVSLLANNNVKLACAVYENVAKHKDVESLAQRHLGSENDELCLAALNYLIRIDSSIILQDLKTAIRGREANKLSGWTPADGIYGRAIYAAAKLGTKEALDFVVPFYNVSYHVNSQHVIEESFPANVLSRDECLRWIQSDDWRRRFAAYLLLGRSNSKQNLSLLVDALGKEDRKHRYDIARGIYKMIKDVPGGNPTLWWEDLSQKTIREHITEFKNKYELNSIEQAAQGDAVNRAP
jgi:HEAT repeat protein